MSFLRQIQHLRNLKYNVLDVKALGWHDDFNLLKGGVKDLEVMLQNVITTSFESVKCIHAAFELQESFAHIAHREV